MAELSDLVGFFSRSRAASILDMSMAAGLSATPVDLRDVSVADSEADFSTGAGPGGLRGTLEPVASVSRPTTAAAGGSLPRPESSGGAGGGGKDGSGGAIGTREPLGSAAALESGTSGADEPFTAR